MSAIILNGTSSAGKTSIAQAIQKLAPEPFLHLPIDMMLATFPWDTIEDLETSRGYLREVISGFHKMLPVLLSGRLPGVIDHVFLRDELYLQCLAELEPRITLVVGVRCSLEIVKSREVARGDRQIGIAETQFPLVHENRNYDSEVDTSTRSPEDCAEEILAAYYKKVAR